MVTKVVMPKLSLTMKTGTVGKWYKNEGEAVEKNEPIVEVFSEKATYDLEAPATGILRKITVQEGEETPVDAVLGIITDPDEAFSDTDLQLTTPQAPAEVEERVRASPAAKRLAKEHSIDLSLVQGSGPEGRITEDDVERFIKESSGALPKVKQIISLAGYRKTSAERLSMSFRTAPHSTVVMEVDASEARALHERLRVSYTAILVKAVANALIANPMINSSLEGDKIRVYGEVNIGVAVATENGLVVPVLHRAEQKPIKEIDSLLSELTAKAKEGKLSKEQVTGGTFTITNLGMYGVDFFIPIINPPEAAILAVGATKERPIAVKGKIETRPMMMLSLAYDHRIVDGAPAAQFLRTVKEQLENVKSVEG